MTDLITRITELAGPRDHPNEVWQIDASISILFYVPEGDDLQPMLKHGEITSKPARVSPTKTSTARQRSTTAEGVSA